MLTLDDVKRKREEWISSLKVRGEAAGEAARRRRKKGEQFRSDRYGGTLLGRVGEEINFDAPPKPVRRVEKRWVESTMYSPDSFTPHWETYRESDASLNKRIARWEADVQALRAKASELSAKKLARQRDNLLRRGSEATARRLAGERKAVVTETREKVGGTLLGLFKRVNPYRERKNG